MLFGKKPVSCKLLCEENLKALEGKYKEIEFNVQNSNDINIPSNNLNNNNLEECINADSCMDEDDIFIYPEPSFKVRTFYRFMMAFIPALLASFCTNDVIGTISTASGLLAPPFVIIFPGLFLIFLYLNKLM